MLQTPKIDWPQLSSLVQGSRLSWFQKTCILGGSALLVWKLKNSWTKWRRVQHLQGLIKKRQAERSKTIQKLKADLSTSDAKVVEKRKWITSLETKELQAKLQNEELSPLEVLEAFQWTALLAQEKTNCITQFVAEARDWCLQLQKQYKGQEKPPLYGLPFSVKESVGIKGYDVTGGMTQFLFDPVKVESVLVARLRQLGAIPFVLTNVPQTLLSYSCSNPIYGLATHPKNKQRTCGGSSGGEGALLAFRGSAFGIGTDLAGSVRIPAHYCGITSLKPGSTRLSQLGGRKIVPGRSQIPSTAGPMANEVDTLAMFMDQVLHPEFFSMDTYIVPVPFRRDIYESKTKLTIGYYDFDGFIEAAPACRRAVHVAKEILEQKGHRLVKFELQNVEKLASLVGKAISIDAGHYLSSLFEKEIIDPNVADTANWLSQPTCVRKLIAYAMRLMGRQKLATFMSSFNTRTRDLAATLASILEYKNQFNSEWRRLQLDAVVCPVSCSVAMPHDLPAKTFPTFLYTVLFNCLDFPAGVVPVTTVTANDEKETVSKYKADEYYAKLIRDCSKEGTIGLPVGVQCAASAYNEEICLRVMKEIEDGVKQNKK